MAIVTEVTHERQKYLDEVVSYPKRARPIEILVAEAFGGYHMPRLFYRRVRLAWKKIGKDGKIVR